MSAGLGLGLQLPKTPTTRPTSSYSGFQLPSSSSSQVSNDSDDEGALPFPTALARNDFLAPDFDAAAYLSSLFPSDADTTSAHRHQTLEDLRSDLRERSGAISSELLELVNANYTAFLGLGDELKGGEERVEDVRVALLGFRRAVDDVKAQIHRRVVDMTEGCGELADVLEGIERGRRMLELDERVGALEARLAVDSIPNGGLDDGFDLDVSDEDDDLDDDVDETGSSVDHLFVGSSPTKLLSLTREYLLAEQLAEALGRETAFVKKMSERQQKCRNTLLLDLSTATKEANKAGKHGQRRVLRCLGIFRLLGAEAEAIAVFKRK